MAEGNTTVGDMARRRRAAGVADQMMCARKSTRARETRAGKLEDDAARQPRPIGRPARRTIDVGPSRLQFLFEEPQ